MMNGHGKSDRPKVPAKFANKGEAANTPAERDGGKGSDQGKHGKQNTQRTQSRESVQSALERVRKVAKSDKKVQFTNLSSRVPGQSVQDVILVAPGGYRVSARYMMQKQSDGVWRINGCLVGR